MASAQEACDLCSQPIDVGIVVNDLTCCETCATTDHTTAKDKAHQAHQQTKQSHQQQHHHQQKRPHPTEEEVVAGSLITKRLCLDENSPEYKAKVAEYVAKFQAIKRSREEYEQKRRMAYKQPPTEPQQPPPPSSSLDADKKKSFEALLAQYKAVQAARNQRWQEETRRREELMKRVQLKLNSRHGLSTTTTTGTGTGTGNTTSCTTTTTTTINITVGSTTKTKTNTNSSSNTLATSHSARHKKGAAAGAADLPKYHNAMALQTDAQRQELQQWLAKVSPLFKTAPMASQEAAWHFLWQLRQQKIPGALVGDEMGGGKTFTALVDALAEFCTQPDAALHPAAEEVDVYARPPTVQPVVILVQNHQAAINWLAESRRRLDLPDNFIGIVGTTNSKSAQSNGQVLATCAFILTYDSALRSHYKDVERLNANLQLGLTNPTEASPTATSPADIDAETEAEADNENDDDNAKDNNSKDSVQIVQVNANANVKAGAKAISVGEEVGVQPLDWLDQPAVRDPLAIPRNNIYSLPRIRQFVVDEVDHFMAQKFGQRSSLLTTEKAILTAVMQLLRLADRSLLLTGTPTLGNAPEGMLRQLLSMMQLHLFMRSHPHHRKYSPLTANGETSGLSPDFVLEAVMARMVRRRSDEFNPNLPTKMLHDINIPLTDQESAQLAKLEKLVSDKLEEAMAAEAAAAANEDDDKVNSDERHRRSALQSVQGLYLKLLSMLRMAVASNLELFLETFYACEELEPEERDKKRQQMTVAFNQRQKDGLVDSSSSSKEQVLARVCGAIAAAGEKAVVFAEWRFAQHRLAFVLTDAVPGAAVFELLSSQTPEERAAVVQLFNEHSGPAFLLLPIKLGGRGLNLQVANHVIMACSNFNPANTDQALARVDRMGQLRRTVHVWTLLCSHTIEQWIHDKISVVKTKEALALAPQDKKRGFLCRREETLRFAVKARAEEVVDDNAIRMFSSDVLEFVTARKAAQAKWTLADALAAVHVEPSAFF